MAALRARHMGCAQKLVECLEITDKDAQEFIRTDVAKWNEFFAGTTPSHLLVYYQPKDKKTEVSGTIITAMLWVF
jgi:hypothetical protein